MKLVIVLMIIAVAISKKRRKHKIHDLPPRVKCSNLTSDQSRQLLVRHKKTFFESTHDRDVIKAASRMLRLPNLSCHDLAKIHLIIVEEAFAHGTVYVVIEKKSAVEQLSSAGKKIFNLQNALAHARICTTLLYDFEKSPTNIRCLYWVARLLYDFEKNPHNRVEISEGGLAIAANVFDKIASILQENIPHGSSDQKISALSSEQKVILYLLRSITWSIWTETDLVLTEAEIVLEGKFSHLIYVISAISI